jgi:nucleoside 2-deoxyribosyltransferase
MKTFLVYLAGPITGLTFNAATDWRHLAKAALDTRSDGRIECLSPMRYKEFLVGHENILALGYDDHTLSNSRGIISRDRFDVHRADLIFVNLLGAKQISIGTVMEMAWADAARIPTVVVMEPSGNLHEHAFISEATAFRCSTVVDAIETTCQVLIP